MTTVRTSPSLDALLPSWARHLRAANLSPRTVQSYAESARRLGAFLDQRGMPSEVSSIRREHVAAFIEDRLANWSPATAAVRYGSLQQLFRRLIDEGEISVSPMARMRPPKVPEQPVAVQLTLDEQRRLLATCEGRSFADRRDAAMLRVFIDTGARLAEAAEVVCAEGVAHRAVEPGHRRRLASIFGPVEVERLAYRHRGHANCYPADAQLNLPTEVHSHGLRRLASIESSRGSFEEAAEAVRRACGQRVGKRQVESLAAAAARDVEDFYATLEHPPPSPADVLVLSADGKGIVMRPEALRPATRAKAAAESHKLECRLSKGEKRNRKRLAEVGAVYDLKPVPRSPAEVMARGDATGPPPAAPVATNKWLTASVVDDAAQVLAAVFDEAERRDPGHTRRWVALVDGNNHQIDRIGAEAAARGVAVTIVVDLCRAGNYADGRVRGRPEAL